MTDSLGYPGFVSPFRKNRSGNADITWLGLCVAIEELGSYFKPEVRHQGEADFNRGLVVISLASDCHLQAYVERKSKVTLASVDISDPLLQTSCNCSRARKAQFCRHIWSVLLAAEGQRLDVLNEKVSLELAVVAGSAKNLELKEKQKEFRREQYQRVKERNKDRREQLKAQERRQKPGKIQNQKDGSGDSKATSYPQPVESALRFFSTNGFEIDQVMTESALRSAWIKLSRIFHPDKGGSHQEAVTLNENFQILRNYLEASVEKSR